MTPCVPFGSGLRLRPAHAPSTVTQGTTHYAQALAAPPYMVVLDHEVCYVHHPKPSSS